ncbi:hypothetical protein L1987_74522 [Smallanthus sonchifolius]|uniref:Uncharacterized protein n=1 Tax=Smallanthus sonchifolius TaxID=185202 RepID=A0ACB9A445_9ASTR|nr:hypothetical protein L1987_74522 [Smallanthus sonchifolius]
MTTPVVKKKMKDVQKSNVSLNSVSSSSSSTWHPRTKSVPLSTNSRNARVCNGKLAAKQTRVVLEKKDATREKMSVDHLSELFMLVLYEKSVNEQARSNDLKAVELGLTVINLKLKEAQIVVDYVSKFWGD